jgi:hypothetical protein
MMAKPVLLIPIAVSWLAQMKRLIAAVMRGLGEILDA